MIKEKSKILFVEDDDNLGIVVKDFLEISGFDVVLSKDGDTAISDFKKDSFDLCLLDIMLPKKDGFTVANEIKNINNEIPFIFLTAKSLKEDKIRGFRIGADDYITKPFSTEELVCRIEAIMRRIKKQNNKLTEIKHNETYLIGNYKFDFSNLTLTINDIGKTLTKKEAELLKLLFLNKNNLVERKIILNSIWGNDDYFVGRSMDVFISRLRKYLKYDTNISIRNIHGIGFMIFVQE